MSPASNLARPGIVRRLGGAIREKGLFGDAGVYVVANVVNALVPFLLVPVLTRKLGPSDYGLLTMFVVSVNVLAALVGLNSNSAVTVRFYQLPAGRTKQYIGACLAILVASTAGILIIALPLRALVERFTGLPALWLLLAVSVAFANFVTSIRLIVWQVQGKPWRYSALVVFQNLINILIAIALVVGLGSDWRGAAAGQAIGALLAAVASFVLLVRSGALQFTARADDVRDALRYGVPLVPHIVGGLLIAGADRLLIANRLGLGDAGVYMVGLQVGMSIGILTTAFNKAYMPWLLSRLRTADPIRDVNIVRGTYAYAVGLLALAASLSLVASPLVRLVAGPDYAAASATVKWVAFAYAFGGMYYMVTNYVFYAGKTARLAWVTVGAGLGGLATSYLLIPSRGIEGAGMGYLLSNLLMFLGTWYLAQRSHPMPWLRALRAQPAMVGSGKG